MADRRKRSHIISYSPYELQRSAQKRVRKDDSNTTTTITTITTTEVTLPLNDLPIPISHPRPFRQLFVCGTGDFGQLGLGVTTENTHIDKPELHYFLDLVISINSKNGSKDPCEAAIEQVCSGGMHSLVVDELGHIWSWGVNDQGALGRKTVGVQEIDDPTREIPSEFVESLPKNVHELIEGSFRAVRVSAGDSFSIALDSEGRIKGWGCFNSSEGCMGFHPYSNTRKPEMLPISIPFPEDVRFVSIACGGNHIVALTQFGTVYTWGNGEHGELGRRIVVRRKTNGLVPERLSLRRIVYVGAGGYNSFATDELGHVFAWGLNNLRQCGIPFTQEVDSKNIVLWEPTEITSLSPQALGKGRRVIQICGGESHTLFLLNDGTVYGCGRCNDYELGLATDHPEMIKLCTTEGETLPRGVSDSRAHSYIAIPTLIHFPPLPTPEDPDPVMSPYGETQKPNIIVRIAARSRHSFAVSENGHAYAWGCGQLGELGFGSVECQQTPRRMRGDTLDQLRTDGAGWKWLIEDVCAGDHHTILLARKTL